MEWRFKLDGNIVTNPNGWDEAVFTIKFDRSLRIYVSEFSNDVEWIEDGAEYIKTVEDTGICNRIFVEIAQDCDGGFVTWFEGYIFVVDLEWDEDNFTVKAPIHDDNWTSIVSNNKSIKAKVNVRRSKNDAVIPIPINKVLQFFDPADGIYKKFSIESYLVFECFEYLVAFMTDGQMGFSSPFFDTGGPREGLCLTTGEALRTPGSTSLAPFTSFLDLFTNMNQLFNLAMYIDLSGASPVLVVDATENVRFVPASPFELNDLIDVKRDYKTELMYSNVRTGSETTQDDQGGTFAFPDVVFLSHKEEEFHVLGECNIDNTLNLVNVYVIDSNVIQDAVINLSSNYDSDVFVVESDLPGTNQSTRYDTFNPGGAPPVPSVYNVGLTTSETLGTYWNGAIPNDLALYLGNGNDEFRAQRTADLFVVGPNANVSDSPFQTPDDFTPPNNNPNGNFSIATFRYTIPATGFYVMLAELRIRDFVAATPTPILRVTFNFERFDSGGFSQEIKSTVIEINDNATLNIQPPGFYANNTDYIVADINLLDVSPGVKDISCTLTDLSYISCIQTFNGGGIFQTFDPQEYPVKEYLFKTHLSQSEFQDILANPNEALTINYGDLVQTTEDVFIEELDYRIASKEADFTVINSAQ